MLGMHERMSRIYNKKDAGVSIVAYSVFKNWLPFIVKQLCSLVVCLYYSVIELRCEIFKKIRVILYHTMIVQYISYVLNKRTCCKTVLLFRALVLFYNRPVLTNIL